MKKLILIDGTALAYRNHFSMIRNPLRNSKGMNTSGLFGLLNSLIKIIREEKPDYLIVAFDAPTKTFRHDMYDDYKSTRAKMPDELRELIPAIKRAVDALNIPVYEVAGVEADDVVGTLAQMAKRNELDVVIYTGDKDFLQLLEPGIEMLSPGRANKPDKLWTVENAHEKFGVRADRILDLLALMGDSSDNIPGVMGIGEKTAVALLKEWDSLDNIYENLDSIKPSVRKKLEESKKLAYLSKELARIRTDLSLEFDLDKSQLSEPDETKLIPLLQEYEMNSLVRRFFPEHTDTGKGSEDYKLVGSIEELEAIVDKLLQADKFALDTETTSENPMRAELVGISLCLEPNSGWYVPLAHHAGGGLFEHEANLPKNKALSLITKLFASNAVKIGQNIKYDIKVLRRAGIEVEGKLFDTMIAAYLLDPGTHQHGLDSLALKYLGHQMTKFSDVAGKGKKQKTFDQIELEVAAKYSCEDVDITMRLENLFAPRLHELQLWELFQKIEMPLVRALTDMEMTGIRLDTEKLLEIGKTARETMNDVAAKIFAIAGEEFNLDSPKQLSHILFDKLGLPTKRKTKTGFSTDAGVMEQLAFEGFEIADYIVEYREMAKLLNTYIEALPRMINPDTGRIHTSLNQTVAATGRLSSSIPNLQNIPIRGEFGAQIRECFVPKADWKLMSADYSQVELRLMAHFSEDSNMIEAFRQNLDIHSFTASLISGIPIGEIDKNLRRTAKTVNFGVIYGQSAFALSQQLRIPFGEAELFIESYFARYPGVKDFIASIETFVEEHGYVETIMGRRRYLPEIDSDSHQMRQAAKRAAVNTPLQGSAADIIKKAMLGISQKLHDSKLSAKMLLQVHDELLFEFPLEEEDILRQLVKSGMENVIELRVPLIVDIGIGDNWGEAH